MVKFLLMFICFLPSVALSVAAQSTNSSAWQNDWDKGIACYEISLKYEEAVGHFTSVIEKSPRFWEAHFRRGLSFARMLQVAEAFVDFQQAIKLNPALPNTFLNELNKYKKQDGTTIALQALFYTVAKHYNEAMAALTSSDIKDMLPEEVVVFCKGKVSLETGKDIEFGCKSCQASYNMGLSNLSVPLLKQYCSQNNQSALTKKVVSHQFIPRTMQDSGEVHVEGSVFLSEYSTVRLETFRNDSLQKIVSIPLKFSKGKNSSSASFSLKTKIKAELANYSFRVTLQSKAQDTVIMQADSVVCGDVYVCAGQSNMMSGAVPPSRYQDFMRTFVFDIDGKYWKTSQEANMMPSARYPMGAFAGELQRLLVEKYQVPICIINGAVGGTTIKEHLELPHRLNRNLIQRVIRSGLQNHVKAVFWYQGESENFADSYLGSFTRLTNEWKEAFPNVQQVYVAQIRAANCNPNVNYSSLRELQRTIPQRFPKHQVFATNAIPLYDGCHYKDSGYHVLASQVMMLLARDFYKSTDTLNITSPTIKKAYISKSNQAELILEFSPPHTVFTQPTTKNLDSISFGLHQTFTADVIIDGEIKRNQAVFSGVTVSENKLTLSMKKLYEIKSISYSNQALYLNTDKVFDGPWLMNIRGIGALSFYRFPITQQ